MTKIVEYHRPETIQEALELLARKTLRTVPLGGGTVLSAPASSYDEPGLMTTIAVVDLQNLELDAITRQGSVLAVGAAVRLKELMDSPNLLPGLAEVIRAEATANLRNIATFAGTLVASDGRSPLAAACLALDAQLTLTDLTKGPREVDLGNVLNARRELLAGTLITHITLPAAYGQRCAFAYQQVARTPADRPIVSVAMARWSSGRLRVVVGGFGEFPRLALDAPEPGGVDFAVQNALAEAGDAWASAAYRQATGRVLAKRLSVRIADSL